MLINKKNYINKISFSTDEIEKIEIVKAQGVQKETLLSRYNKFPANDRPTILTNLGMFALNSGIPVTNVKINNKMVCSDARFCYGLAIPTIKNGMRYSKLDGVCCDFCSAFPCLIERGVKLPIEDYYSDIKGATSRLGIGYKSNGDIEVVAVDKDKNYRGATLSTFADIGMADKLEVFMNFDGGGSTHILLNGVDFNKPTENRAVPIMLAIWLKDRKGDDLPMGKSVYLSPSTQENNVGVGGYGTEERRMNEICDIVEVELKRHGVLIGRNKPSFGVKDSVADSNRFKPDLHLAIHSNASNGTAKGALVFAHRLNGGSSHVFANNVYGLLSELTPWKDFGVKAGFDLYGAGKHLYETAYTNGTACLVEVDFHDNKDGANFILNNIEAIGVALAKGCLLSLGIAYIPKATDKPTTPTPPAKPTEHWAKPYLDSLCNKGVIANPSSHNLNEFFTKGEICSMLDRITDNIDFYRGK